MDQVPFKESRFHNALCDLISSGSNEGWVVRTERLASLYDIGSSEIEENGVLIAKQCTKRFTQDSNADLNGFQVEYVAKLKCFIAAKQTK